MPPTYRDLASTDLWSDSLDRSQRRRELSDLARKHQARHKSAALTMSAAMATAPAVPTVAALTRDTGKTQSANTSVLERDDGSRVLLKRGMTSPAVVELQEELKIAEDGIYGPITEAAVKEFQKKHDLKQSGKVDVRTWLLMFPDGMIVFDPHGQTAQLAAHLPPGAGITGTGVGQAAAAPANPAIQAAAYLSAATGPESSANLRKATTQTRLGGAPADAEPDQGILPDEDARDGNKRGSKKRGQSRRGSRGDHSRSGSRSSDRGGAVRTPSVGGGGGGGPKVGGPIGPPRGGFGGAQQMIAAMIAAANRIDSAHYGYRWGGGHNPRFSGPYDCSGAVSAVLHAAGLISAPMVSGDFMRWGRPGAGAVTIYANAGHVYMSINGRFFGTTRANPGGGAGWFNGSRRAGFVVVHVPFESIRFPTNRKASRSSTSRTTTRAATTRTRTRAQQEPQGTTAAGGQDAQSGGATYSSDQSQPGSSSQTAQAAPSGSGQTAQTAPSGGGTTETAPAQSAPVQAAPAPQAAPVPVAPAPAPAPQAAPVQAAPAPVEAAPAAPVAPAQEAAPAEAAPVAEAPAQSAPAAEAPKAAEQAAPEAEAPAAEAPKADESASGADAASGTGASG